MASLCLIIWLYFGCASSKSVITSGAEASQQGDSLLIHSAQAQFLANFIISRLSRQAHHSGSSSTMATDQLNNKAFWACIAGAIALHSHNGIHNVNRGFKQRFKSTSMVTNCFMSVSLAWYSPFKNPGMQPN